MTGVLKGSNFKVVEQSDKHVVYDLQSKPIKESYTIKNPNGKEYNVTSYFEQVKNEPRYTVKLFRELFD